MDRKVLLCLAHMGGREQEYIQQAFDTGWVVPLGPNVNGFESDLQEFLDAGNPVVALSSGTAAIHLALVQLGVGAGDEVVCQSFTFAASANPIVYQGATPVFVDSERVTWNMDPELLERAIIDRKRVTGRYPKAIIPVHLYGMPAQMDAIMAIARKYGIPVVEDAAEALGSEYKGRKCGTIGDFGALSFNGNKMITTSGGGALVCAGEDAKKTTMFYATQAREARQYYQHEKIGYNYRMSNICAGIGRGQMHVLNEHIAHHRMLHDLYRELFADVEGVSVFSCDDPDIRSNYWLSCITVDNPTDSFNSDTIRIALESEGIESRPLWKPMHLQPVFSSAPRYTSGVSEELFDRGLCIPSGPMVTVDDAMRVVSIIRGMVES